MLILGQNRASQLAVCLAAASHFHLDAPAAMAIFACQIRVIGENWRMLRAEADLGEVDRALFWGRQLLNPFAFYGLTGAAAPLAALANQYRLEQG
jgi:serine/threonine-protein kinase HipA